MVVRCSISLKQMGALPGAALWSLSLPSVSHNVSGVFGGRPGQMPAGGAMPKAGAKPPATAYYMSPMPPPPDGMEGALSSAGISLTRHSVVTSNPAMLAAFRNATRVTLVGAVAPAVLGE